MLYIKGFERRKDGKLYCRDMQFEIGKEYKIDSTELKLCSNTVFHFCKTLKNAHWYYNVRNKNNVFCYIEALGEVVENNGTYSDKCGSNHIKIVREIVDEELNALKGLINGNLGYFNSGNYNSGDYNSGDRNSGHNNSGDYNSGYYNSGHNNSGDKNTGYFNSGDENFGNGNSGNYNSGYRNSGNYNSGHYNSGNYNSGDFNSGHFNKCKESNGVFCTTEPKICIFDIQTDMTLSEFRKTEYMEAICSAPFALSEWICDELKSYTYKEACNNWWNELTDENRQIIMQIPNFNKDKFFEITGIEI